MGKKSESNSLTPGARFAVISFGCIGGYAVFRSIAGIGGMEGIPLSLMLLLAAVTAHVKVRLMGGSTLSLLTSVVLFAVMSLGTKAAILVGVCGVLVQCTFPSRRFIAHHLIFNVGMISLTVSAAGMGYEAFTDPFVGILIGSLLYYLGNSLSVSLIISLSSGKSFFRLWHDNFLYTAPSFFVAGLLAYSALPFASSLKASALLAVLPILYLSYYSHRVYLDNLEAEKKHAAEMADLYNSALSTLALAIDAKDRNTHGHIQRVQKYSRAIAEALHLEHAESEAIAAAALLHDIGKLAVPEYILSKKGPLTPEEMRKMRLHPELGAQIISNIKFQYPVVDCVLAHHERFDGLGYPNGLQGKDIPLGARVLAVADVFDACMSDRDPNSEEVVEEAMQELRESSGTMFDPDIVAVWESIYRDIVKLNSAGVPRTAYSDIQRATCELKVLESLGEAVAGLTRVEDIAAAVSRSLSSEIPGVAASLRLGAGAGVPVNYAGKTIASITASRPAKPLNDDETRLLTAVAEKISGALHNASALEAAHLTAMRDRLTGLANRRAFEFKAESLAGQPCSVVIIDVDSFKAINDNFGHQSGDAVLVRIAGHLQKAFSDVELICRLGGDEFVVISLAESRALRRQVRAFRRMVVGDPAHAPYRELRFGISCGTGSIPADGLKIEEAISAADQRMYAIKARVKSGGCLHAQR